MWVVKITPIDVPNKIVRIVATRTDDAEVDPDPVYTIMFHADISTPAKKLAAMDRVWAKYLVKAAKQTAIDALISDLETIAAANLEARES